LITFLANRFQEEHGANPLTDPHAHQELRTKAEACKKRLTAKTKDPFTFAFAGSHCRIEVERQKFEEITADLIDKSIQCTKETLAELEAKTGNVKIDRIFLVGGSSRMPIVKTRVDQEFGLDAEKYDPDECVAKGAAIWAVKREIDQLAQEVDYDTSTGAGNKAAFKKALDLEIATVRNRQFYLALPGKTGVNVSSHTYGILAWDQGSAIVAPLLSKNQEIPLHLRIQSGAVRHRRCHQATVDLILMEAEGDSLDPAQCKEIGRGTVELPPGVPQGSEVKIWFQYGADGTMSLRAKEVSTNRECEVTIQRAGVMDMAEVAQAGDKLAVLSAR
jgi:molecular chaperone DnaK (HSP70)